MVFEFAAAQRAALKRESFDTKIGKKPMIAEAEGASKNGPCGAHHAQRMNEREGKKEGRSTSYFLFTCGEWVQ